MPIFEQSPFLGAGDSNVDVDGRNQRLGLVGFNNSIVDLGQQGKKEKK